MGVFGVPQRFSLDSEQLPNEAGASSKEMEAIMSDMSLLSEADEMPLSLLVTLSSREYVGLNLGISQK